MYGVKNKKTIYLKVMCILSLIAIRNILEIEIPVLFILGCFLFMTLISNNEEIICLAIACIPMSTAFQYKYALMGCFLILLLKNLKRIKIKRIVIPIFLMMVWEILHCFNSSFSLIEYLRGFSETIFLIGIILFVPPIKVNYYTVCRILAISVFVMGSIVFLEVLKKSGFNVQEIFKGTYRLGISNIDGRDFGINFNANGLGTICNLAIIGLYQLILTENQKKYDYVLLFLIIIIGIMTMSRNFILCLVINNICFFIAKKCSNVKKIKIFFLVINIFVLLFYSIYKFLPTLYNSFIGRFSEADLTNGRAELFMFYNKHIISNVKYLFFGIGMQNFQETMENIYGNIIDVCHNGFQELLVSWGIPGLILFLWFILELIIKSKKINKRHYIINYMPLIFILVNVQSGQMIRAGHIMLSFCLIYLSSVNYFRYKKDIKNYRGVV